MHDPLKLLSDLVFYRTYSKTLENGRKESYNETVSRCEQMHLDKFKSKIHDDIRFAFDAVRDRLVVPSMRSMQFSGDPIVRENARMYNCSAHPLSSVKTFSDLFYLLMCGCGTGYSVQSRHVNQLPYIKDSMDNCTFVVPDSREGWADSIGFLFRNPRCSFDYSLVRPAGALLSSGGTASGPEPLKVAHNKVREILIPAIGRRLRPYEAHSIMCHIADAVVVGGVRRAAMICLFDANDTEMLACKSGNWWETNPQFARANNTAIVVRNDPYAREYFDSIMDRMYASNAGEPGLAFLNDPEWLYNPCQPAWAQVLTPEGIRTFADIEVGSTIWSGKKWTKVVNKWSTGVKDVFRYHTTRGYFDGTANHRILSNGIKVEAGSASSIDSNVGPYSVIRGLDNQDIMDGLVLGDGAVHKASNSLIGLYIGDNDQDYWKSSIAGLIHAETPKVGPKFHAIDTTLSPEELPRTFDRKIPDRFFFGSSIKKAGLLRGLFSANGSVVAKGRRVTLKGTSFELIRQVQVMLSSIGISSYVTTNKPSEIEWDNGTFVSKESYDLNISTDRYKFLESIGFIQEYKNNKITGEVNHKLASVNSDIYKIENLGEHEVFDITVEDDEHTYWTSASHVSNCGEISLKAFCNLTEINAAACKTKEDFFRASKAATIIGKLQSTYTKFNYISPSWKRHTEEEMLLGVSITGQAEAQHILTPENLRYGANILLDTDKEFASILDIPLAHRIGTTKPSGSTSALLGTTSGVHAAHAPFYIRRVRVDVSDPIAIYLADKFGIGDPCSNSVIEYDKFKDTNIVVSVPVNKKGAIYRGEEGPIQLMERSKVIYENWIKPTHRQGPNTHNVSITVNYKEDEKDSVRKWMWENRESYSAISLLPYDLGTYVQMPFDEISESEYHNFKKKFTENIDFSEIDFSGTVDERAGEVACGGAGGGCELK